MTLAEILSVSAAWVGAFGTISAVGVALWLAGRSARVRLKAHVGVYHLATPGAARGTSRPVSPEHSTRGPFPIWHCSRAGWLP